MNERIKELMPKAYELQRKKHGGYFTQELLLESFAELIVKECASIANTQFSAASGLDDRDCWTAGEIKKYFGVEE
jgi:hypothetical protein